MAFRARLPLAFLVVAAFAAPRVSAHAQSLDLTINHTGLSIGDSRFVRGVRLNFRDRNLELVEGINVTVWSPYEESRGVVKGLAIGLPITGARRIHGGGFGIFGDRNYADDDCGTDVEGNCSHPETLACNPAASACQV